MASISEQISSVMKCLHKLFLISQQLELLKNLEDGKDKKGLGRDRKG